MPGVSGVVGRGSSSGDTDYSATLTSTLSFCCNALEKKLEFAGAQDLHDRRWREGGRTEVGRKPALRPVAGPGAWEPCDRGRGVRPWAVVTAMSLYLDPVAPLKGGDGLEQGKGKRSRPGTGSFVTPEANLPMSGDIFGCLRTRYNGDLGEVCAIPG